MTVMGMIVGTVFYANLLQRLRRLFEEVIFLHGGGGEEFVLLMDNCPFSVAQERAEMIRNRIQEYTFDGVGHLTCSMGLTLLRPSDDIHTFLKRADEAMYQAKTHGRYQVCVS